MNGRFGPSVSAHLGQQNNKCCRAVFDRLEPSADIKFADRILQSLRDAKDWDAIIKSTVFGVRSAIWTFEKDDEHPAIILFPMLHIAERSFYEEVSSRSKTCDVILYEGVRSRTGHWISSAYLQMIKNPEHGLVTKEMPLEHVKDRLVHADVDGQKLDEKWGGALIFQPFSTPGSLAIGRILSSLVWFPKTSSSLHENGIAEGAKFSLMTIPLNEIN